MDNLERRRCNRLPTATCVLCHLAIETMDHLFFQCSFARHIWGYFTRLCQLPDAPRDRIAVWGDWRAAVRPTCRLTGDLIVKAIVWSIWLARNACIFNAITMSSDAILYKIDHLLLFWFSSAPEGTREKLDFATSAIHRSLEF
ncbi:uncharacterized protein LOC120264696 [Dioscorea cayenensis subsp. rotundata]|uniref:Uncharacterized protein LOC120264696 n=1 Tax=Dioscorea cayennensis subsp. rotundata TaxID=55577 RepID=A0AB40BM62_DIOCR|nr:uncharacterized protein LOC120264696 [Dioscorea cayenensis subsp. rotundata]